jgi:hypothetical protein
MLEALESIWRDIVEFFSPSPPEPVARCTAAPQTPDRGPHASADDAARAALDYSNPRSIAANREYGGLIYRDAFGQYFFSGPVVGGDAGVNPSDAGVPPGDQQVGDYHTHADYSTQDASGGAVRTSDPARDDYNSDHFSGTDYDGITSDGAGKDEYRGYLGTPSGTYRYFDPHSGDEGTL